MTPGVDVSNCVEAAWCGWDEWRATYADLFALDDAAARARGVGRVRLWRARVCGSKGLPLAVEAPICRARDGLPRATHRASRSFHEGTQECRSPRTTPCV